ncbi:MAG: glycosyltransferase, partial [Ignavibacteriae bacterium]|nr:glycosyltransferase [Ignavibacteriota bacterium]
MSRSLIVIPTYNEAENIPTLIPIVLAQHESLDVLVVDDNSPDGTARIVKELQAMPQYANRLFIIERPSKQGLGT